MASGTDLESWNLSPEDEEGLLYYKAGLEGRDCDWDGHYVGASRVPNKVLLLVLD